MAKCCRVAPLLGLKTFTQLFFNFLFMNNNNLNSFTKNKVKGTTKDQNPSKCRGLGVVPQGYNRGTTGVQPYNIKKSVI